MRRRSTFVHDPKLDIDSNQLYVSGDRFVIEDLRSAREERLTLALDRLPEELWQVLGQSHELHIRWASQLNYNATSPFASRTSPGLHVFYTPLQEQTGDLLCPLLLRLFSSSLKCDSVANTFTTPSPLSRRFASMSAFQYHSHLSSLSFFTQYVQRAFCKQSEQQCLHSAALLNLADTLDIDYDSISHTLTLTVHWSKPPPVLYHPVSGEVTENAWSLTVEPSLGAEKVEVGVLNNEPATDPFEVALSGILTTVGKDNRPNPTRFSFPSRHHLLAPSEAQAQQYSVSFPPSTGLHPTMQISFPTASALAPPSKKSVDSACALHAYLTLPSALFADKYQLSTTDQLFLQSHNLVALRALSGETDLEAPDYVIKKWGSNVLFELATPSSSPLHSSQPSSSSPSLATNSSTAADEGTAWNITIPLHARYLPPSSSSGHTPIPIAWPIVFWACTTDEGTKFPVNPFDRVNLGYDGLFGPRTMFYHLDAETHITPLLETVLVPVLDLRSWGAEWVQVGTLVTVLLGFLWVCTRMWGATRGIPAPVSASGQASKAPRVGSKEKKKQ